jgi:glycosyltransferase involved in cell wall biosynthesis
VRILYVNNINQVAEAYAGEFARRGHSTALYQPALTGSGAALPAKLALMPWRMVDLRKIAWRLDSRSFDIAHIHWAPYGALDFVSKIPIVVHCHGSDVRYRLRQPIFRSLLRSVFRRAACVLCITPDLLPVVQEVCPNVQFSPAPIDTHRFMPAPANDSSTSRAWTVLLFARLHPNKGSEIAMQGLASFAQQHRDIRVKVLDAGPLRNAFRQRYDEIFEFIPPVAASKVESLIHDADAVVGQLALGAMGLSELQAMSCGKPVVASFRYEDAYNDSPPLCQASTPDEVHEHLEYLLRHPGEAQRLGVRARDWVITYHDLQKLADRLETLYQSVT